MSTSSPSIAEDFNEPWGDEIAVSNTTTAPEEADDFNDAWGEDPFSPASANKNNKSGDDGSAAAAMFDDKGEPDFAGWLNAQAQAKSKQKKAPLPKGLTKTTGRPVGAAVRSNTTGTAVVGAEQSKKGVANRAVAANAAKPAPKKVEEKAIEEDEGWGDAWD